MPLEEQIKFLLGFCSDNYIVVFHDGINPIEAVGFDSKDEANKLARQKAEEGFGLVRIYKDKEAIYFHVKL